VLVLRFVQCTQAQARERLEQHYPGAAEREFFTRLGKALKERGLLDVLRKGIKIVPHITLSPRYFRPVSGLEPKRVAEYQANILSVMDEVEYSRKHGGRLNAMLFVNGLPVITIEAKNRLTGSTFRHAEKQYRDDRSPAGEPLLTFKRATAGALRARRRQRVHDDAADERKDPFPALQPRAGWRHRQRGCRGRTSHCLSL